MAKLPGNFTHLLMPGLRTLFWLGRSNDDCQFCQYWAANFYWLALRHMDDDI